MVPLETRPDWKLLLYVHFFLTGGKSAPNIFMRLAFRQLHIKPLSLETERAWLIANTHDETLERGSDAEIAERESRQARYEKLKHQRAAAKRIDKSDWTMADIEADPEKQALFVAAGAKIFIYDKKVRHWAESLRRAYWRYASTPDGRQQLDELLEANRHKPIRWFFT
jgi:hypothetical protein